MNLAHTTRKPGKHGRRQQFNLLADNKFQFTLSGHSHRAGIYTGTLDGYIRPTYTVKGHEVPLQAAALPAKGACNMVVSGSSGPVGVQNHQIHLVALIK